MIGPLYTQEDVQLDDCSGSNANPINGRISPQGYRWAGGLQGQLYCKLATNFIMDDADGSTNGHCHIDNKAFGPNQEVQITLQGIPIGTNFVFLMARVQRPPSTGLNAYYFGYQASGTQWALGRIVNNDSPSSITSNVAAGAVAVGDKMRLRCHGNDITGWCFRSGAWELVIQAVDQQVRGGGTVDIEFAGNDAVGKCNDVRGGTIKPFRYNLSTLPAGRMEARS